MSEDFENPLNVPARSINNASNQDPRTPGGIAGDEPGDAILLNRAAKGDQQAMAKVFDRYSSIVYSVALRVLRDAGQAEDIVQEIFLQVWLNPGSFVQGRGTLGAWLSVVARNRSIDVLRRRKPAEPVDEVRLPSTIDLASEAERNTMIQKVRKILNTLPQEQRYSMELAFFEGLTHSEIAQRTGDPLGTVKTRIRTALIELRKALA